jgi:hypothetical protein
VRTIKLCATSSQHPIQRQTTLLEAIRRSASEIERSGRIRRPLPAAHATIAPA